MSASMAAAQLLRERGINEPVEMAILLGTGLGALAGALDGPVTVSYRDLPGFPETTVRGHEGQLAVGVQEGVRIAYLQGGAHFYENSDAGVMASALETLAILGAWIVLLTSTGVLGPPRAISRQYRPDHRSRPTVRKRENYQEN